MHEKLIFAYNFRCLLKHWNLRRLHVKGLLLIPIFSFFLSKMNAGIVEEATAEVEAEVPEEGEVLVHEM